MVEYVYIHSDAGMLGDIALLIAFFVIMLIFLWYLNKNKYRMRTEKLLDIMEFSVFYSVAEDLGIDIKETFNKTFIFSDSKRKLRDKLESRAVEKIDNKSKDQKTD